MKKTFDLLSPCSDFIFKNIFGKSSHKRALISLINAILAGKPHIKDLTIENPDIPKDLPKGKSVRLDIRATADDNTKLGIEIQCCDDGRIMNRSAFYQCRMMPNDLKEGEEFDALPNMISIWIANYDETKRQYHTHEALFTFQETPLDPAEVATEKFRTIIVELPKVDIKQANIKDMFRVWMYFLRNPEKIPAEFLDVPEVEEAMNELQHVSQNPEMRKIYEERLRWQDNERNLRAHHYNKGRMEEKREAALSMLTDGMSSSSISKYTGLSEKEINSLKQ
ncbi:MAG: Rpn family recombination-promoting nuclease/putative transposase [Holosporaceae bacterium]|nr:Rpn family recombination-promoting nuclease/putative transposase [Holosporaceae bacterium]